MSIAVLVIGKSGAGKSRSLLNLDPATTFLIAAMRKPLPFRGWKEKWREVSKENKTGNFVITDDAEEVRKYLIAISDRRPEAKTIVIDDSQYIMANEFMRCATEKGYEKFTRIGQGFWLIAMEASKLREDLTVVFLQHEDMDDSGEIKAKTIGKMLDNTITLEGMFTIVLRATKRDGKHVFLTSNSGKDTVKAPEGMFSEAEIQNDLNLVLDAIHAY